MNSPILQQRPLPRHNSSLRTPWAGTRCRQARPLLRTLGILVALVLGSSSCGLPTIPFLDPPRRADPPYEGSSDNAILYFDHNPSNDIDDFKGYELFYKFYTRDQRTQIDDDANEIASDTGAPNPRLLSRHGFVRAVAVSESGPADPDSLRDINTDQKPHLPTPPTTTEITYEIDLQIDNRNSDQDVYVSWNQGGEKARGFRRRNTPEGEEPTFSDPTDTPSFWNPDTYTPEDEDIKKMGLSEELESGIPDSFYIVWYVMSYGIDGRTLSANLYSEPLRLEFPDTTILVIR